ncbi:MAG: creatininase family protein [Bacillota bacterium]
MGYLIKDLTYEECLPLINEKTTVVLPIGGASKEHGGHLPMGTDYYVTDWVANEVTKRCDVVTLPTVPYAYFPAFVDWKGSVSVDYPYFIAYVRDILMSFVRFGVRKFLLIDGGVSTHGPLVLLSKTLDNELGVKVAVSDITQLAAETEKAVCSQPRGGHGDESETSTMLYIREDLVHMDKTVEEYTAFFPGAVVNGRTKVFVSNRMCTPHGINGNSKLATKEKGEKILFAMVDALEQFLAEFTKWERGDIK